MHFSSKFSEDPGLSFKEGYVLKTLHLWERFERRNFGGRVPSNYGCHLLFLRIEHIFASDLAYCLFCNDSIEVQGAKEGWTLKGITE